MDPIETVILDFSKSLLLYVDKILLHANINESQKLQVAQIIKNSDNIYTVKINIFPEHNNKSILSKYLLDNNLRDLLKNNIINIFNKLSYTLYDISINNITIKFHGKAIVLEFEINNINKLKNIKKTKFLLNNLLNIEIYKYAKDSIYTLSSGKTIKTEITYSRFMEIDTYKYIETIKLDSKELTNIRDKIPYYGAYYLMKKQIDQYIKNNYNILIPSLNDMNIKDIDIYMRSDVNVNYEDFPIINIEVKIDIINIKLKTPAYYEKYIIDTNKYKKQSKFGGLTSEQINESAIVSVNHNTYFEALENIIEIGFLRNRLSLSKEGTDVIVGVAEAYQDQGTMKEESAYKQRQFPGIYTTLAVQNDYIYYSLDFTHEVDYYKDQIMLVMSSSLLKQRNWHLNLMDNYGSINNFTFVPKTLSSNIHKLIPLWKGNYVNGEVWDNELVIHDDVSIDFIRMILVNTEEIKIMVKDLLYKFDVDIEVFVKTKEIMYNLAITEFEENKILSNISPQLCYTGLAGDHPSFESEEDFKNYIYNIGYFKRRNPYTLKEVTPSEQQLLEEGEYIKQKTLENCDIKQSDETTKQLFGEIEDKMQSIYFEDGKRNKNTNFPPWRYTPEYYERVYPESI